MDKFLSMPALGVGSDYVAPATDLLIGDAKNPLTSIFINSIICRIFAIVYFVRIVGVLYVFKITEKVHNSTQQREWGAIRAFFCRKQNLSFLLQQGCDIVCCS
jgi:hypothetical protein